MVDYISVSSDFSTFEFAAFIDLLNQMAPALGQPCEIEIDLSIPSFFGPSGMVPLLAMIADLANRGWTVKVAPPDPHLEDYWRKAGWLAALMDEDPPEPTSWSTFVPLARFQNSTQMNVQMNVLMDILAKVSYFEPGVLKAVEWTMNELADNVLVHSGGAVGWLQIVARPNQHRMDLVVADTGLGIRRTIREGFPEVVTDTEALRIAVQRGTTRDKTIGQGNGLAGSLRIAEAAHGWVNILSGIGMLRLFDDGHVDDLRTAPYTGTVVAITLPTNAGIDVSEALWGYNPGGAFEFSHVTQDGILFRLLDEATGFGNRGTGGEMATKLRNIMREFPEDRVIIDFEGVEVPTASFLDEFLAKMIKAEGVTAFFSRVQFRSMNELVRRTADTVIAQRLGQN
jgi:hypothetical protein